MQTEALYNKLIRSYTEENLNRITAKIIELYKAKNYDAIFEFSNILIKYGEMNSEENVARCFSRLLMIYHPDRGNHYRNEIEKNFKTGNFEVLSRFSHIFEMSEIDQRQAVFEPDYEDIDYHPEYIWDYEVYEQNSFIDYDDEELNTEIIEDEFFEDTEISFFQAIKRKMYGNLDMDMPEYFLEQFDEIELPDYELNNLDGIESCKNLIKLDLSGNKLHDITSLFAVKRLEELYLNENDLSDVDILSRLDKLKILDVAHNSIEDIRCLYSLENLEYINLVGNPVPNHQIEFLQSQGVIVIV